MQRTMKRIGALILALAMLVTFMPALGLTETAHADETQGSTVKVDVLTQDDENTLLKAFQDLEVSSEAAEEFGYEEPEKAQAPNEDGQIELEGKVTTLDALVTVLKDIYGDAFTKDTATDYLVVDKGTIKKIFGKETTMTGFTVNGKNPLYKNNTSVGSTIYDTVVEEGDSLRFFRTFADEYDMGGLFSSMLYFDEKDQASYATVAGKPVSLKVSAAYAFETMMGGPESSGTLDPEGIELTVYDSEGNEAAVVDADEEGHAEINLAKGGDYTVVVSGYEGNMMDEHFVTPYAEVKVYEIPEEVRTNVKVAVRNFEEANKFDVAPQVLNVSSNAAEGYGEYRDIFAGNGGKVTLADVIFTMHSMKYGDAFNTGTVADYIIASDSGYFSKCFGQSTFNISYLINEDLSMTGGIFEIAFDDGDRVDLYKYIDEVAFSDLYAKFDVEEKIVKNGEAFSLQLEGIGWNYTGVLKKSENKDIVAATYDESGNLAPVEGVVMDEDGKITLTFNEPGKYFVTASGYAVAPIADYSDYPDVKYVDGDVPIILPYCEVTVLSDDEYAAKEVEDVIDAIGDVTLDSEDAINAAEEAYEALTDAQKALVNNYETLLKAKVSLAELKVAEAQADIDDGDRKNQTETTMNKVYSTLGMFRSLDEGTTITPKDDKTVTVTIKLNPSKSNPQYEKIALAKYGKEDSAEITAVQENLEEAGQNDKGETLYTCTYTFDMPVSLIGKKMPYSIYYKDNGWHKFSSQPYMIVLSDALYKDLVDAETELEEAKSDLADYLAVEKQKVAGVKVVAGKKKATISWKSLGEGYTYKVYQLNASKGTYKAVKTTTKTKVVVKKLKKGKRYCFKVQAQKKVNDNIALTKESKVVKSKKIK